MFDDTTNKRMSVAFPKEIKSGIAKYGSGPKKVFMSQNALIIEAVRRLINELENETNLNGGVNNEKIY